VYSRKGFPRVYLVHSSPSRVVCSPVPPRHIRILWWVPDAPGLPRNRAAVLRYQLLPDFSGEVLGLLGRHLLCSGCTSPQDQLSLWEITRQCGNYPQYSIQPSPITLQWRHPRQHGVFTQTPNAQSWFSSLSRHHGPYAETPVVSTSANAVRGCCAPQSTRVFSTCAKRGLVFRNLHPLRTRPSHHKHDQLFRHVNVFNKPCINNTNHKAPVDHDCLMYG
jgi:hypothetical protein